MKTVSESSPGRFASRLNWYLRHLNNERGWDASGRSLERVTEGKRGYNYWRNLLLDERAMNANDIAILAEVFQFTPDSFVRAAVDWSEDQEEMEVRRMGLDPATFDVSMLMSEAPATPDDLGMKRRQRRSGSQDSDLYEVEIETKAAASTDDSAVDPTRGEA